MTFDEIQTTLTRKGTAAATATLGERLRQNEQYHELFDLRLLEARLRLGLPVILTKGLDDLDEPLRSKMEDQYLAACREVGSLLLNDGRVREAWMYLRPVGDKAGVAAALEKLTVEDDNREQVIEVALHEGVCPRLGFELVLKNYGVCNAISMFDSQMHSRPRHERQEVAALLVARLHDDLTRSLRDEIAKKQGSPPAEETIEGLVADRDWLFDNNNYHLDTSHLAAVVRFALVLDAEADLRRAVDLTEYGRRLSSLYQYPGQEPFVDCYPTHAHFFRALLANATSVRGAKGDDTKNEEVEEAIAYFRGRAEALADTDQGAAPGEIYVGLLSRLGRHAEAFEAAAALLAGLRTSGFAPSLFELAQLAGKYDRLAEVSRERGDLLGFAMGLFSSAATSNRPP
ncbi:MAG TPA: hypothetical protein VGX76_04210 [Pirellulales bacterium]|nr:hypothetical protein [Pirellulales bacterium]